MMLSKTQLCGSDGFPGIKEEFHPWALREGYQGCSDMEELPLGAGRYAAICCSSASTFCQRTASHSGFEINSGFGFLG